MIDQLDVALKKLAAAERAFGVAIINGDLDAFEAAADALANARTERDNILLDRVTAIVPAGLFSIVRSPEFVQRVVEEIELRRKQA